MDNRKVFIFVLIGNEFSEIITVSLLFNVITTLDGARDNYFYRLLDILSL